MSETRKDLRGRILKTGEDQMPDGRYRYRYTDDAGKRHAVYSWRLTEKDPVPRGKRTTMSLRGKEAQILADLREEIDGTAARRLTVDQAFQRFMETRRDLKATTRANYFYIYEGYIEHAFGQRTIGSVRFTDVRDYYVRAMTEGIPMRSRADGGIRQSRPLKPGTLKMIHAVMSPLFEMAVRDGWLRRNPCIYAISEARKHCRGEQEPRHALTMEQQSRLVSFVAGSSRYRRWLPLITVFLGTGCRVGELIGLRWEDCDFDAGMITIGHSVIYRRFENGGCELRISTPKTQAGKRTIPMLREVCEALLKEKELQKTEGPCVTEIGGMRGFIFRNRAGQIHNPSTLNRALERMRLLCNKEETESAALEGRQPVLVPHFSAHSLRHTFCTRFCENETNLKMIQSIMGHSDIRTTMNIYAEAMEEQKRQSMKNLEGKIRIS